MDVFLSLYVLQGDGDGQNPLLPVLLAAKDEDAAIELSDLFIEQIERLADPGASYRDKDDARDEIAAMRASVCLLEEDEEIQCVLTALRQHNPDFDMEVRQHPGGMFVCGVTEDAGFEIEAANLLRNRMCGHRLLASLSIEIDA